MVSLIWTIVVVLFVLWLLGFALHVAGGLIHLLWCWRSSASSITCWSGGEPSSYKRRRGRPAAPSVFRRTTCDNCRAMARRRGRLTARIRSHPGGVCSGLGAYFRIDALAFASLRHSGRRAPGLGFGSFLYLALWS